MQLELPITQSSSDPNEDGLTLAEHLTLSWHNISVWVKRKNEEKSNWFRQEYQDVRIINKGKNNKQRKDSIFKEYISYNQSLTFDFIVFFRG